MKKVISGKLYSTETAHEQGNYEYSKPNNFRWFCETLYQKKNGEFFLHGKGGPMSLYCEDSGQYKYGGETIVPLSVESAKSWGEKHLSGDAYIEIFGTPEE